MPVAFVACAGLFFKSKEEISRRGGSSALGELSSRSLKKITGAAKLPATHASLQGVKVLQLFSFFQF